MRIGARIVVLFVLSATVLASFLVTTVLVSYERDCVLLLKGLSCISLRRSSQRAGMARAVATVMGVQTGSHLCLRARRPRSQPAPTFLASPSHHHGVITQSTPSAIILCLFGTVIATRAPRLRPPGVRLATTDAGVIAKGSRATGAGMAPPPTPLL